MLSGRAAMLHSDKVRLRRLLSWPLEAGSADVRQSLSSRLVRPAGAIVHGMTGKAECSVAQ
jgi:hypothetical protein